MNDPLQCAVTESDDAKDAVLARSLIHRFTWLAAAGFLLNGNWEWLQTPFFRDATSSLNRVVWFRLHCTVGDVLILLTCAVAVSIVRRSTSWLVSPDPASVSLLTFLGVVYTAWSEHTNLTRGAWAYSDFMPLIPGTGIGIVPMIQWLLLPALSVWMAARLTRSTTDEVRAGSARPSVTPPTEG